MNPRYITMQSIINYRIPIQENGRLGTPEVLSKFTREVKGNNNTKKKPKTETTLKADFSEEVTL